MLHVLGLGPEPNHPKLPSQPGESEESFGGEEVGEQSAPLRLRLGRNDWTSEDLLRALGSQRFVSAGGGVQATQVEQVWPGDLELSALEAGKTARRKLLKLIRCPKVNWGARGGGAAR